ncbi:MAG: hypothetical protein PHY56_06470, partial [Candidatus Omnitrophica bacterium]|nr:hypothetical protein [Candidatus Omnitrophota bacterium]
MDELIKMIQHRLITDYDILLHDNISGERLKPCMDKTIESLPAKEQALLNDEALRQKLVRRLM